MRKEELKRIVREFCADSKEPYEGRLEDIRNFLEQVTALPIDLDKLDVVLVELYGVAPQGGYLVTIKENEWRDEDLKRYEGNGEDLLDG